MDGGVDSSNPSDALQTPHQEHRQHYSLCHTNERFLDYYQ